MAIKLINGADERKYVGELFEDKKHGYEKQHGKGRFIIKEGKTREGIWEKVKESSGLMMK